MKAFNRIKKYGKRFGFVAASVVMGAAPALATATDPTTGVTIDTTYIMELVGIILIAIAAIWPVKKLIKLGNKS